MTDLKRKRSPEKPDDGQAASLAKTSETSYLDELPAGKLTAHRREAGG